MAPSGRKHSGKAGKPAQEDQAIPPYDFPEEGKELSGSEEDIREGAYIIIIFKKFMVFLTMNRWEYIVLASAWASMVPYVCDSLLLHGVDWLVREHIRIALCGTQLGLKLRGNACNRVESCYLILLPYFNAIFFCHLAAYNAIGSG